MPRKNLIEQMALGAITGDLCLKIWVNANSFQNISNILINYSAKNVKFVYIKSTKLNGKISDIYILSGNTTNVANVICKIGANNIIKLQKIKPCLENTIA